MSLSRERNPDEIKCDIARMRSLSEELAQLERSDPTVRAAAESFERTKQAILEGRSHPLPCRDLSCHWHHLSATVNL